MAPQQLTIQDATNTDWFKKSAVKMAGLFVAGLLFTALLYNRPANNGTQQSCMPAQKQVATGIGSNAHAKDTQCSTPQPASSFSMMPGGLSRFLQ